MGSVSNHGICVSGSHLLRRDIDVDGACGLRGGAVGEPRVARTYGSGYATNERIPSCYLQFYTSYLRGMSRNRLSSALLRAYGPT